MTTHAPIAPPRRAVTLIAVALVAVATMLAGALAAAPVQAAAPAPAPNGATLTGKVDNQTDYYLERTDARTSEGAFSPPPAQFVLPEGIGGFGVNASFWNKLEGTVSYNVIKRIGDDTSGFLTVNFAYVDGKMTASCAYTPRRKTDPKFDCDASATGSASGTARYVLEPAG
jgi:hypothetical protein